MGAGRAEWEERSNVDRVRGREAGGQRELRLRPLGPAALLSGGRVVVVVVVVGAGQRQQGGGAAVRRDGGERRGGAELHQRPARHLGRATGSTAQEQVSQPPIRRRSSRLCQSPSSGNP